MIPHPHTKVMFSIIVIMLNLLPPLVPYNAKFSITVITPDLSPHPASQHGALILCVYPHTKVMFNIKVIMQDLSPHPASQHGSLSSQ